MRATPPSLWGDRDFVLFWSGRTVSLFGDHISLLALPLTAIAVLGAGAQEMALLAALAGAPAAIFSLPAGAWESARSPGARWPRQSGCARRW